MLIISTSSLQSLALKEGNLEIPRLYLDISTKLDDVQHIKFDNTS